jgi:[ribosomal protein S5]-alanine N-acetyltransferase
VGQPTPPDRPGVPWATLPEVLRTRRLVLRPPRPADAPAIFARWDHDPEVYRYLHRRPATAVEQTDRWIRGAVEQRRRGTTLTWALTLPEDDRPLGVVVLTPAGHTAELGYGLARDAWGRGFATEAADAVVRAALALPGASRVWAKCDVDNAASARVMEKVGMQHEGTLRRYLVRPALGPEPRDTPVYARVR